MNFIGEHLTVGYLGRVLVWVSFITLFLAVVSYLLSSETGSINFRSWRFYARQFYRLHFYTITLVVAILVYIIVNHYFEYKYVWKHTSKDLSLGYLVSSVWSGQEGSFLLWIFIQGFIGFYLLNKIRDWEMPVMTVISLSQLFLTAALLGVKVLGIKIGNDPFLLLRQSPENLANPIFSDPNYLKSITDGAGLNPLLLNFWMKAHPPVLFLGFATAIVPFAFAVASLWKKKFTEWIKPVIPWLSFSALALGCGLLMGGAWAYQDLTFGGFWAWDPVENSSLVPWILLVASLHLVIVSKVNKQTLFPAILVTILAYVFVLYSTFLTRSGLLSGSSAHAFNNTGQALHLAVFVLLFFLMPVILLIINIRKFPKGESEKIFSKEFWMFIGSIVLVLSAFQIIFSTSTPIFNKIFGIHIISPSNPVEFYNKWQLPFVVVIGLLMTITQFLRYGKNNMKEFLRNTWFSLSLALVSTVSLYFLSGIDKISYYIMAFAMMFIAFSSLEILFSYSKRHKNTSSLISHFGFGIFVFGIILAFSQSTVISKNVLQTNMGKEYNDAENMQLPINTVLPAGDYTIDYTGLKREGNKVLCQLDFTDMTSDKHKDKFTVFPSVLLNSRMGDVYIPATKHFITKDVYTYLLFVEKLDTSYRNGYKKIREYIVKKNDTVKTDDAKFIIDAMKIAAVNGKMDTNNIEVLIKVRALAKDGKTYSTSAMFKLEKGMISYIDGELKEIAYKLRLESVSSQKGSIVLGIYKNRPDTVIIETIIFPYIIVLWVGGIIMFFGFLISILTRRKRRFEEKVIETQHDNGN